MKNLCRGDSKQCTTVFTTLTVAKADLDSGKDIVSTEKSLLCNRFSFFNEDMRNLIRGLIGIRSTGHTPLGHRNVTA